VDNEPPFTYEGPPHLLEAATHALRQVIDPEVAMDIVDVGLVYALRVPPDGGPVHVRMTMTSAACPVTDMLVEEVQAELSAALPGEPAVEVELVWEPPWTPERLSANARRFMGW
jgi:metal-sulfur cluster biosynthetic enzyme